MTLSREILIRLAYALGVGLIIGLERSLGWARHETPSKDPAPSPQPPPADDSVLDEYMGLRTFTVLSLMGFAGALLGDRYPAVPPVALGAATLLIASLYFRAKDLDPGITTELAAVATCGLGMLCRHEPQVAGAIALVLATVLASKRLAHATIRQLRWVELTDTLKFLIVIFIVLPLLPYRALDPWGAFNPGKVGLLVVLISGISFVGYFLTRILGAQRGMGLTGILGGLTSSTAVTAAMSAEARRDPSLQAICAFATVAANATMFTRVLVVVALLHRPLAEQLAWSVGAMAGVAAIAALVLWTRASKSSNESVHRPTLSNPFSITPALKFAAFYVGILFFARIARMYLGNRGLYLAAGASGLADVDAITLTLAEQARSNGVALGTAALAITIAVVANSVVKTTIAFYSGGVRFGRVIGLCLGAATVAGLGMALVR